jgi:hypothetical protein
MIVSSGTVHLLLAFEILPPVLNDQGKAELLI